MIRSDPPSHQQKYDGNAPQYVNNLTKSLVNQKRDITYSTLRSSDIQQYQKQPHQRSSSSYMTPQRQPHDYHRRINSNVDAAVSSNKKLRLDIYPSSPEHFKVINTEEVTELSSIEDSYNIQVNIIRDESKVVAKERFDNCECEKKELQEKITAAQARLEQSESTINSYRNEVSRLKSDLAKRDAMIVDLRSKTDTFRGRGAQLTDSTLIERKGMVFHEHYDRRVSDSERSKQTLDSSRTSSQSTFQNHQNPIPRQMSPTAPARMFQGQGEGHRTLTKENQYGVSYMTEQQFSKDMALLRAERDNYKCEVDRLKAELENYKHRYGPLADIITSFKTDYESRQFKLLDEVASGLKNIGISPARSISGKALDYPFSRENLEFNNAYSQKSPLDEAMPSFSYQKTSGAEAAVAEGRSQYDTTNNIVSYHTHSDSRDVNLRSKTTSFAARGKFSGHDASGLFNQDQGISDTDDFSMSQIIYQQPNYTHMTSTAGVGTSTSEKEASKTNYKNHRTINPSLSMSSLPLNSRESLLQEVGQGITSRSPESLRRNYNGDNNVQHTTSGASTKNSSMKKIYYCLTERNNSEDHYNQVSGLDQQHLIGPNVQHSSPHLRMPQSPVGEQNLLLPKDSFLPGHYQQVISWPMQEGQEANIVSTEAHLSTDVRRLKEGVENLLKRYQDEVYSNSELQEQTSAGSFIYAPGQMNSFFTNQSALIGAATKRGIYENLNRASQIHHQTGISAGSLAGQQSYNENPLKYESQNKNGSSDRTLGHQNVIPGHYLGDTADSQSRWNSADSQFENGSSFFGKGKQQDELLSGSVSQTLYSNSYQSMPAMRGTKESGLGNLSNRNIMPSSSDGQNQNIKLNLGSANSVGSGVFNKDELTSNIPGIDFSQNSPVEFNENGTSYNLNHIRKLASPLIQQNFSEKTLNREGEGSKESFRVSGEQETFAQQTLPLEQNTSSWAQSPSTEKEIRTSLASNIIGDMSSKITHSNTTLNPKALSQNQDGSSAKKNDMSFLQQPQTREKEVLIKNVNNQNGSIDSTHQLDIKCIHEFYCEPHQCVACKLCVIMFEEKIKAKEDIIAQMEAKEKELRTKFENLQRELIKIMRERAKAVRKLEEEGSKVKKLVQNIEESANAKRILELEAELDSVKGQLEELKYFFYPSRIHEGDGEDDITYLDATTRHTDSPRSFSDAADRFVPVKTIESENESTSRSGLQEDTPIQEEEQVLEMRKAKKTTKSTLKKTSAFKEEKQEEKEGSAGLASVNKLVKNVVIKEDPGLERDRNSSIFKTGSETEDKKKGSKTPQQKQALQLELSPEKIIRVEDERIKAIKARVQKTIQKLRDQGLKTCGLIVGIDCTASNIFTGRRSFGGRHLHDLSNRTLNFYEQVLSILGSIVNEFTRDGKFPVYFFGDNKSRDRAVRPLYSSRHGSDECHGIEHALAEYRRKITKVGLSGPTSFRPLIDKTIEICKQKNDFHLLIIIGDGAMSDMEDTVRAIVEASNYPIAIVMVGVGDGDYKQYPSDPWRGMKNLDDMIPQRRFDNFNFIQYEKNMLPEEFAEQALEELSDAYKFCVENKMMEPTTVKHAGDVPPDSLLLRFNKQLEAEDSSFAESPVHKIPLNLSEKLRPFEIDSNDSHSPSKCRSSGSPSKFKEKQEPCLIPSKKEEASKEPGLDEFKKIESVGSEEKADEQVHERTSQKKETKKISKKVVKKVVKEPQSTESDISSSEKNPEAQDSKKKVTQSDLKAKLVEGSTAEFKEIGEQLRSDLKEEEKSSPSKKEAVSPTKVAKKVVAKKKVNEPAPITSEGSDEQKNQDLKPILQDESPKKKVVKKVMKKTQ